MDSGTPTTKRRVGYTTVPNKGSIPTEEIVRQLRSYRGLYTFRQLIVKLGFPSSGDDPRTKWSWFTIRDLCERYQIATADPTEPEDFRKQRLADIKEETKSIRATLIDRRFKDAKRAKMNRKKKKAAAAKTIASPKPPTEKMMTEMAEIQAAVAEALKREIAEAKAELANPDPKTKPFKPGALEW